MADGTADRDESGMTRRQLGRMTLVLGGALGLAAALPLSPAAASPASAASRHWAH